MNRRCVTHDYYALRLSPVSTKLLVHSGDGQTRNYRQIEIVEITSLMVTMRQSHLLDYWCGIVLLCLAPPLISQMD